MRITHVIESTGGSADFMLYLIRYLPSHDHTVVYGDRTFKAFGGRFDKLKSGYPNAKFIFWKYIQREISFWSDLKSTLELFRIIRKLDSDVIHLHSSKAGFIGRIVCFALRKNNVIYTPNGLPFLRLDVSKFSRHVYIFLEKIAYKINGKVIACSKSECESLMIIGIPSNFINNGTEVFKNIPKKVDDQIIIATTGRITAQKNPYLFNEAASFFIKNENIKFQWIGDGELRPLLTSPNIEITGWMERVDVLGLVKNIDIYLSTALWEGLPFAVLEAMNLNKPLLLSNCIGNIDLVVNNGFIYNSLEELIERIVQLIDNKSLRYELGANSFLLVEENFNVVEMAKQYEKEYISVSSNS